MERYTTNKAQAGIIKKLPCFGLLLTNSETMGQSKSDLKNTEFNVDPQQLSSAACDDDDDDDYLFDAISENVEDFIHNQHLLSSTDSLDCFSVNSPSTSSQYSICKTVYSKLAFHLDHVDVRRKIKVNSTSGSFGQIITSATSSETAVLSDTSTKHQWCICEKYANLRRLDGKLGNVFLATEMAHHASLNMLANGSWDEETSTSSSPNNLWGPSSRKVVLKFIKCNIQEWYSVQSGSINMGKYLTELETYWQMSQNIINTKRASLDQDQQKTDNFERIFFNIYVDKNFLNLPRINGSTNPNQQVMVMMVMPYFECNLNDLISQQLEKNKSFSFMEVLLMFKQILYPICNMHQMGYAHHNLKPENIFIVKTSSKASRYSFLSKRKRSLFSPRVEASGSPLTSEQLFDVIITDPYPRMSVLQRTGSTLVGSSAKKSMSASFYVEKDSIMTPRRTIGSVVSDSFSYSPSHSPTTNPSPPLQNNNSPFSTSLYNLTLILNSAKSLNDFKIFPNRNVFEQKAFGEYMSPELRDLMSSNGKKNIAIKSSNLVNLGLSTTSSVSGIEDVEEASSPSITINAVENLSLALITSCDIFALGLIFYQILSLDTSLDKITHCSSLPLKRRLMRESILMNYRCDVEFLDLYERLIDIIVYQMLAVHPMERITSSALYNILDQMEMFLRRRDQNIYWDFDLGAEDVTSLLKRSTVAPNTSTLSEEEAESIYSKLMILSCSSKNAFLDAIKRMNGLSMYSPVRGYSTPYQVQETRKNSRSESYIGNALSLASNAEGIFGTGSQFDSDDEIDLEDPFSVLDSQDHSYLYRAPIKVRSLNQLGFAPEALVMQAVGSYIGFKKYKLERYVESKRSKQVFIASREVISRKSMATKTLQYKLTGFPIHNVMAIMSHNPTHNLSTSLENAMPYKEYCEDVSSVNSESVDNCFNGYNIFEIINQSYNYTRNIAPITEKFSWVNMHYIAEPIQNFDTPTLAQYFTELSVMATHVSTSELTPSYYVKVNSNKKLPYLDEEERHMKSIVTPLPAPSPSPFTTLQICNFCLQIAEAMHYLHQNDIVHGNISVSSVLFSREKDELFLSNFDNSFGKGSKLSDIFNAPEYLLTPNSNTSCVITEKLDIFQFGILMIELSVGVAMDASVAVLAISQSEEQFLRELDYQFELRNTPKHLSGLIKSCVAANPKKRTTTKEILYALEEILKKK